MFLTELVCGLCGKLHSKDEVQSVCRDCGRPLLARYDLLAASAALQKEQLAGRESSLWRYRELLPFEPGHSRSLSVRGGPLCYRRHGWLSRSAWSVSGSKMNLRTQPEVSRHEA